MLFSRRFLLSLVPAAVALPVVAHAADDDPRAERFVGNTDAKVTVQEFFSLTCSHCAAFGQGTFQQIKINLIDTGKVRWVFRDYPLDQTALLAAQVARYLPVDRYLPFIDALFATQNRWAFNRGANPTEELWKTAALAGMSRTTFDKAISDSGLRAWILEQQQADTNKFKIDSTPSFVVDGQKYSGEMSYEAFRKLIPS